jgi:radical SAM-linked protein
MRIRIIFSKTDAMRYTGHLDLFRSWERTFRRSGLPLAYSQGFHPQPRLNLACALPLGFTSECEVLDAWLECSIPIQQIYPIINRVLPPGVEIHGIEPIDDQAPALQTQVVSATYVITFLDDVVDLTERVQRLLGAEHLPRQRRNKPYDLRPLIEQITIISRDQQRHSRLSVQLSARESATGRPEELLDEMGVQFETTRIHRKRIAFSSKPDCPSSSTMLN